MSYLKNLLSVFKTDGLDLDRTEGAILGAPHQITISVWCAKAQAKGKRWGCICCKALSILVQHDHCKKQLSGVPMTWLNYIRAFVCLLIPVGLLAWGIAWLIHIA